MKTSNVIKYVLSFLLAGVLVYFAFKGVDWQTFWQDLRQTRWGWVGMFIFFSVLALALREERWRAIIRPIVPRRCLNFFILFNPIPDIVD